MAQKKNYLLEKVKDILEGEEGRGRLLDIGCGDGDYAKMALGLGFKVVAADIDQDRFRYRNEIEFRNCDVTKEIPFPDNSFDYILFLEIIEHLKNPYIVLSEVNRILKSNGTLILSTPNILNLKSRLRYLFEGAYEYFREPPLDQAKNPKEVIFNLHLVPYRYQELEYLLSASGFKVEGIFTSVYDGLGLWFLLPFIKFQAWQKQRRALKKGGIDYRRINKVLLSKELLFGRHLMIQAKKSQKILDK
ncbi:MAG: class I SAM-dependent methyltransferase [Candidatus Omnitrophica bacterium]|nr:class I SAM-dependent methyltransferase [Candidatus Omnitrophota bacterium]